MTRYLVLIYGDEQQWAAHDDAWNAENGCAHQRFHAAAGAALIAGGEVVESASAVTVRGDAQAHQVIADGPFAAGAAATGAAIGGFYLIDAADQDAAVALARLIPEASAPGSGVEVRAMPAALG